jgi:predicted transglutaminase-like cysteine proteinase
MGRFSIAFFVALLSLVPISAAAGSKLADAPITTAAATIGEARPPIGYVGFCMRYPQECARRADPRPAKLDAATWALINNVNDEVNRRIQPVTDKDHWGLAERWDLPADGRGDCEDYALLKQKILIEKGIPAGALLITVVIDREGAGHAVLTLVTDRGDFVLDNQEETILPWITTGYRFVKRQSMHNANNWVTIDERGRDPVATAAR